MAENRVRIVIEADGKDAQKVVEQVGRKFSDLGDVAEKGTNRARTGIRGMDSEMRSIISAAKAVAAVLATAFVAHEIADYAKESALLAARYETLGVVMETVGKNAGYSAEQMTYVATSLQKTGISMIESRAQATKLVQAHIDLAAATDLARLAQDAAVIAGENSSVTFAKLVDGIQTGQIEILRNIGLNVDFEASYKRLAQQLGKTTDSLTANEKMQARVNEAMSKAPDIAGAYANAMETTGKAVTSLSRYSEDFQVKLGEAFGPASKTIVDALGDAMKDMQEVVARPEVQEALAKIANLIAEDIASGMNSISDWMQAHGSELPTMAANSATGFANLASKMLDAAKALRQVSSELGSIPKPLLYAMLSGGAALITTKNLYATLGAAAVGAGAGMAASNVDAENAAIKAAEERAKKEQAAFEARFGGSSSARKDVDVSFGQVIAPDELEKEFKSLGGVIDLTSSKVQEVDATVKKATKGAARYAEDAANLLNETKGQVAALMEQMGGNSLSATLQKIDNKYDKAIGNIREKMVGAKGDTTNLSAAIAELEKARGLEKQIAETKAWSEEMGRAAETLRTLGELTGDPDLLMGASLTDLQQWATEQEKIIKARYSDETEQATRLDELKETVRLKELEEQKAAYTQLSGISSSYWTAERALLEEHLERVKNNADSETGYQAYAAQMRDDLRKRELEARLGYEDDFLGYLKDRLNLELGLYQSSETRKRELWATTVDALIDGLNSFIDIGAEAASGLVDIFFDSSDQTIDIAQELLDSLRSMLKSFVKEMAAYFFKNYLVLPIVGSFLGIEDSSGGALSSLTGSGSSSNSSIGSLFKSSGLNDLLDTNISWGGSWSGASGMSALSSAGSYVVPLSETGISTGLTSGAGWSTGAAYGTTAAPAAVSSAATSVSLSSVLAGVGGGFALGTTLNSLLGGDSTTGMATSGGGAVAGAALGTLIAPGAGTVLGGLLGGLFGGGASGLFSSGETKTEAVGSGSTVYILGGDALGSGYTQYRHTDSKGDVSHTTGYRQITSDEQNEIAAAWSEVKSSVSGAAEALGIGTDAIDNFSYAMGFDANSAEDLATIVYNLGNAMTVQALQAEGLEGAIGVLASSGENAIDVVTRLGEAMSTGSEAAKLYGIDLDAISSGFVDDLLPTLAAAGAATTATADVMATGIDDMTATATDAEAAMSMVEQTVAAMSGTAEDASASADGVAESLADMAASGEDATAAVQATEEQLRQLAQAEYLSQLSDEMGGMDNVTAAFARFYANAYTEAEQLDYALQYYASKAGDSIGQITGAATSLETFWADYRQAMSGALTPEQFHQWATAAEWVETFESQLETAGDYWSETNAEYISGLQEQSAALEKTIDSLKDFLVKVKEMRRSLRLDSDTTQLSAKQALDERRAYFDETAAKARSGDTDAQDALQGALDDYIDASRDYYGSSSAYFADVQHADETLASLESWAQSEVGILEAQLAALNTEIQQLTLVNQNLGTLAGAMESGLSQVAGAVGSSYQASYAAAIQAANAAQASAAAAVMAAWSGAYDLGGDAAPGFALVGESGPELVRFAQPGHVLNAASTSQALQRIADNAQGGTDTRGMERRLDRQAALDADGYRRLESKFEDLTRAINKQTRRMDRMERRAR